MKRRDCLLLCCALPWAAGKAQLPDKDPGPKDWVCPMDPDYRSDKPGVCPRCGMKLISGVPDRLEYLLDVSISPQPLKPGDAAVLIFRVQDPARKLPVRTFQTVHEKLMHLFLVSENLEYFAHLHPAPEPDGTFRLVTKLPLGGMYRMLADYYPAGGVPQLSIDTFYVDGGCAPAHLQPALAPSRAENLTAGLRMDPEQPVAGLESKLFFTLDPGDGLEPYLGAWAHMLAASEDLVDLLHFHPFLADGGATVQFNVIFPRPGLYRVWTQFQRKGVVNTTMFTIPVKAL
jgi:hypothetical protein